MSVYEVHLGSWRKSGSHEDGDYLTYRELAHQLADYVKKMGFTHIELLRCRTIRMFRRGVIRCAVFLPLTTDSDHQPTFSILSIIYISRVLELLWTGCRGISPRRLWIGSF